MNQAEDTAFKDFLKGNPKIARAWANKNQDAIHKRPFGTSDNEDKIASLRRRLGFGLDPR